METANRQDRLDALCIREAQGTLTEVERAELEALYVELDAAEAEALRPALEQMQARQSELQREKEKLADQAAQLERIIRDHEQLLVGAREYLMQLRARRTALADEFRRITGRELTVTS